MVNAIAILLIAGTILGLCITQQEATEREMLYRIRTFDLLRGINL